MTDPAGTDSASVLTTLGPLPSDVSGRLPLWYQVSQSLRAFVAYQRTSELIRLPTEAMLARHYGVSVATVRQALASLEADGLIMRHRRRGTFIKPGSPGSRALRVLGSVDTVLAQQAADEVRLLGRGVEEVPVPLREHFPEETKLAVLRRLRFDGPEATSYAENFVPVRYSNLITDEDLATMPVTMILRDRLRVPLGRIENSVEAQCATPRLAALLSVDPGSPILLSANLTYDAEGRVVDAAYIHYRGDRFRFAVSVDLG
ncbi:GntR family transcriptional regulator [Pseudonocardia acaciae]|uniref:GntR family transcriptional regulator n=1 Tax=Pseudonocardia acaciae TaxID=551276 RepID=UPI000ABA3E19|nr:GntR family transcriptional regulator [Pseudonocardia acaciae]